MPLFRVTVKQSKLSGGERIERGMQADVVTNSMSNPLTVNGGQAVADALVHGHKATILTSFLFYTLFILPWFGGLNSGVESFKHRHILF